jgi:hypothetical protein
MLILFLIFVKGEKEKKKKLGKLIKGSAVGTRGVKQAQASFNDCAEIL